MTDPAQRRIRCSGHGLTNTLRAGITTSGGVPHEQEEFLMNLTVETPDVVEVLPACDA
jgi:hypothetical protein